MSIIPDVFACVFNGGSLIWDACSEVGSYHSVIFNECTATVIAVGIAYTSDGFNTFDTSSSSYGGSHSSHGYHSSHDSHSSLDSTGGFDSIFSDTPLADNLPSDFKEPGPITLSDVINAGN